MPKNQLTDKEFYLIVGNKIRLARKEKAKDPEILAFNIGLSRSSIINIEKGRQRPSLYQIWLMAQFLEIPLLDLVPPIDLSDKMDNWLEILNKEERINDNEQKTLLEFISATSR